MDEHTKGLYIYDEMQLEVTKWCPFECRHCMKGKRQNHFMSYETMSNVLKQVKKIRTLLITGGEPFLAIKQLKWLINIIDENNIEINEINIVTNRTVNNSEIPTIIKEFKKRCERLNIAFSNDIFHQEELARTGLKLNEYRTYAEISSKENKLISPIGNGKSLTSKDRFFRSSTGYKLRTQEEISCYRRIIRLPSIVYGRPLVFLTNYLAVSTEGYIIPCEIPYDLYKYYNLGNVNDYKDTAFPLYSVVSQIRDRYFDLSECHFENLYLDFVNESTNYERILRRLLNFTKTIKNLVLINISLETLPQLDYLIKLIKELGISVFNITIILPLEELKNLDEKVKEKIRELYYLCNGRITYNNELPTKNYIFPHRAYAYLEDGTIPKLEDEYQKSLYITGDLCVNTLGNIMTSLDGDIVGNVDYYYLDTILDNYAEILKRKGGKVK